MKRRNPGVAIAAFERAVRVHELKGAHHPDQWDWIEDNYERAKKQLLNYIRRTQADGD